MVENAKWFKLNLLNGNVRDIRGFDRVIHNGREFRDDCTEFILSVFLHSWLPATVNFFLYLPITPLKYYIQDRIPNLIL